MFVAQTFQKNLHETTLQGMGMNTQPFNSKARRRSPIYSPRKTLSRFSFRSERPLKHHHASLDSESPLTNLCLKACRSFATATLSFSLITGTPTPAEAVTENQLIYLEAWRAVDRAFYDKTFNGNSWFRVREKTLKTVDMPTRQSAYEAIRDTLKLLDDPFTRFLGPEQYSALASGTRGSVTGVGLEVGFDASAGSDSSLLVVAPAPDGPADRAGIRPKDSILEIDGVATQGMTLYEAADRLQGDEGSEVELLVLPSGGGGGGRGARAVRLARERIRYVPVTHGMCGAVSEAAGGAGRLGYVRLASFNSNTAAAAKDALRELKAGGAERYVLDLRNNGGGLFPAGVEVARLLINAGEIVLIADGDGVRDIYSADFSAVDDKSPVTVLVNRGTASAAEVLTGALQDNGRALVAGERTFGKGVIQTVVPLSDGSAVTVTVAEYQTPSGTSINKVGIQPDLPLETEVPSTPREFCQLVEGASAPRLFQ
mmetsp:Transcript_22090/g.52815  ORF Transcript_22090/g.52815 Transcript_22090/m.52815 type:complete len:485 (-) Transcript_22090:771-2225(-)